MVYFFTYFFTKALSFCFFPRKVHGFENLPIKGAYVLASNHISNLDPPILGISTKRRLHFMAKAELFKNPIMGWWLKQLWAFPIKRGTADLGALKQALKYLEQGEPVLVFPEGTRRAEGKETKVQPGAGFLVNKSQAPVVPVLMQGSDKAMPRGSKSFKRVLVTVTIGKPFTVPPDLTNEEASVYILNKINTLK